MSSKAARGHSPETPSPAATGSGISQTFSPPWNSGSKNELVRPSTALTDAGKACAGSRETTSAETVSPSLARNDRTWSLRASTMRIAPTEGAIRASPSPLGVTSASPPLQTLVTESRQFSCGGENTTRKALLLRRGWRRKRKRPRFGTCPVNRWAVLLLYCLYCVFAGPAYINWTPLADILFRAGAFAWTCDENSSNRAAPRRRVAATSSSSLVPPAAYARSPGVATPPDNALSAATGTTAAPTHAPGSSGLSFVADGTSSVHQINDSTDAHSTRCAERHQATAVLGIRSSESMVRCADQEAEVNRLFTVTAASHFFFSFIGGILLDTLGPKVTSMVGLSFGMIGWVLLGTASKEVHSYLVGCLFLGAGIDTTYFPLLSGANLFPGHVSTVKALFGAAASFSFAVPLVLRGVYFTSNARIKHSTLFFGYAGVCLGAALLIAIFVVPWKPWKSPYRSLLSGERQRPHPLAAACGLATQSSQLPAAASDRAFDIIAVHYSSSSLISPASLSALPEEPPLSSSYNSRDGNPTSNPLATAAPHLHPADIHGDEQSASATSSQAARFAAEAEYGQCDGASKSASDTQELNLSSSRASYANGATNDPSTKLRANHPSLCSEYSNSSGRKSPAGMRPRLRLEASRSKENKSPPKVSDGSLCGQGSCSQLPHTIYTDSHHGSPSFSLDSATLASPWQHSRGRESICFAAWPAGIRAKAGAIATESASVPTPQPCDKPETRATCTSAVDKSAKRSLCCSVEVPPAAARPSLLLGNTSAHAAASSNAVPLYEDKAREKGRASVKGRPQVAPLDRLLSSTDICVSAGPPRPYLPFEEHPSAVRHMKVPCVYACSDTSRPTWTRRPWLPNAAGANPCSSTPFFPSSSTSSSPPVGRSPSVPIAASCRSYLPSHSFLLQASQPIFPLPPVHVAEASQVFTTNSAPASTAASLCIRKGETAHMEDASSPPLLFSKSTPLGKQKPDACTRRTPAMYREDNSCQSYDAERAVEETASGYTVVTSAVHAAAAVVEGDLAEHSAAATADNTTKKPRSLHKMAQQQQQPFAGDNAKGGRAPKTSHFQPSATCRRSASGTVPSADSLCDTYQEMASGGALNNATAHVETRSAPAAVLEDTGIESNAHVGNKANSVSPSPPAVSMGSVSAATPLIKRTQASETGGDAASSQTARAGGLSATVARDVEPILFRTTPQQQSPACSASEPSPDCTSMRDTVLCPPLDARNADASIPGAARASAPVVSASVACSRDDPSNACVSLSKKAWRKRSSRSQDSKQGARQHHCLQQLLSARREFLSALYLPIVPFFCIILTGMVFFIPSARHLLPSAYAANRIIQIFSFLPCPLFGHIADVCGIMPVMYICNFCGLLSFLFVMIPHIPAAVPLQYMASLLSASQLSFLVCQICCYVAETFDDEHQGKLIGTLCCIAGLTSLSAHYIMDYAVRHGFLKPLIVFTAALAFNFPLLGFVHWRKQRTGRIHVAGRVFLSQKAPEDAAALGSRGRHKRHVPLFVEMSGAAEGPSPSPSLPLQPAVHNSSCHGAAAVSSSGADAIANDAHAVSTSADAVATSATAGTTFTAGAATFTAADATPVVGAGTPAVVAAVSACPDASQR